MPFFRLLRVKYGPRSENQGQALIIVTFFPPMYSRGRVPPKWLNSRTSLHLHCRCSRSETLLQLRRKSVAKFNPILCNDDRIAKQGGRGRGERAPPSSYSADRANHLAQVWDLRERAGNARCDGRRDATRARAGFCPNEGCERGERVRSPEIPEGGGGGTAAEISVRFAPSRTPHRSRVKEAAVAVGRQQR